MSQPTNLINTQVIDFIAKIIFSLSKEESQILTDKIQYTQ